jgi:hypothetical protein
MIRLVAWLAGSKIGRWVASVFLILSALSVIALRIYSKGKQAERFKQTEEALKRVRERMKSDADIGRMPSGERRKRLSDDWFH